MHHFNLRYWNKGMLVFAAIFWLLAMVMLPGAVTGAYPLWSKPGATLFQMSGSCLVCLWGAWLMRDKPKDKGKQTNG